MIGSQKTRTKADKAGWFSVQQINTKRREMKKSWICELDWNFRMHNQPFSSSVMQSIPGIRSVMRSVRNRNFSSLLCRWNLLIPYDFSVIPFPYTHNNDISCQFVHVMWHWRLVMYRIPRQINACRECYRWTMERRKKHRQYKCELRRTSKAERRAQRELRMCFEQWRNNIDRQLRE